MFRLSCQKPVIFTPKLSFTSGIYQNFGLCKIGGSVRNRACLVRGASKPSSMSSVYIRKLYSTSAARAYEDLLKVLESYKELLDDMNAADLCDMKIANNSTSIPEHSSKVAAAQDSSFRERFFSVSLSYVDNNLPLTNSSRTFDLTNFSSPLDSVHIVSNSNVSYLRKIQKSHRKSIHASSEPSEAIGKKLINEDDPSSLEPGDLNRFMVSYDPSSLNENVYGPVAAEEVDAPVEFEPKTDVQHATASPLAAKKGKKKKSEKCEVLERAEKKNYFHRSLKSYIQICGSANMVSRAHETLVYYRFKNRMSKTKYGPIDVEVYNEILNIWAAEGNIDKVKEVFAFMNDDAITPNLQSYASLLECLSKCRDLDASAVHSEVKNVCKVLEVEGKNILDIFSECEFTRNQIDEIESLMKSIIADGTVRKSVECQTKYVCELLEPLNVRDGQDPETRPYYLRDFGRIDMSRLSEKQLQLEADYFLNVKSVIGAGKVDGKTLRMRKCVEECVERFKRELTEALDLKLESLHEDVKTRRCMTLYPYLYVMDKNLLINILIQEIRILAESAEYFSPNIKVLCRNLGVKVMHHYFIWLRKRNKVTNKISFIYKKYIEYLLSPELTVVYTPREYWQFLKYLYYKGPTIDVADVSWPHHVQYEVGKFLYEILLENASFDVSKVQKRSKTKTMVRPFYTTYERAKKTSEKSHVKTSLQMRAHPKICKMYHDARLDHLEFDVTMVPMLCPPRPWTRIDAGGLLMTATPFIRLPPHSYQQNSYYNQVPNEQLYPCFDSLNSLSLCPWIINKPMLDVIIEVFRSNGCVELDIPQNPETFPEPPRVKSSMSDEEKRQVRRQKAILKKKKLETASLWFDCLYKLSIANHFRDKVFWFPHNLDFRGRVYPTPPHFNHLGSDMVRSILLFSEGKPLGKNGLDWLKIHLINLTGFKKREPSHERLKYANEILPDILDSADNPLTGKQWWKTSDEPWQTLACCKEVANAVRSPDPVQYISHFPIHQDGSCNGLQHYAALGRDDFGAREVNLFPSDRPQDVYSGVAALVEEERKKDAIEGVEVAKVLEGYVKRKVVKQTVMTVVYGVTEYGAKQQILRQLQDIPEFPEQYRNQAAQYLMKLTFLSLQRMFTATREIQNWFTDCAELITRISGKPVEWVTPLGLPVIQPYHRKATVRTLSDFIARGRSIFCQPDNESSTYVSTHEIYQSPNVRKQKNAFAPNFIHSLDSSHMMLTSLFCQRKGLTFVSVHDCYWTHPATVEIMNRICREQFVSLHSQPILENLSEFFLEKYGNLDLSSEIDKKNDKQIAKLCAVLRRVPQKGSFDLKHVLRSVYFFS